MSRLRALEVYLVGSIAREEIHRTHDVDLLVVSREASERDKEELLLELRRKGILQKHHPLDIHIARPEEREKWLKHSKRYKRLYAARMNT